jgi:flagellin-like protein
MFECSKSEIDRGQVGIGTLIVFIAMVLVAAIAAGVLVNTADMLQESAEQTGEESQAQVSDRLRVIDTYGDVDIKSTDGPSSDGDDFSGASVGDEVYELDDSSGSSVANSGEPVVHELGFLVMRAAGSNDINIETVTVSWQGPNGAQQVTVNGDQNNLDSQANRVQIEKVAGSGEKQLLDSSSDRSKIIIKLGPRVEQATGSGSTTTDNMGYLTEGDEVTVKFNTEAGATVTQKIKVPSLIQDDDTIEL